MSGTTFPMTKHDITKDKSLLTPLWNPQIKHDLTFCLSKLYSCYRRCDPPVFGSANECRLSHQDGSEFLHKRQGNIYYGWKYGRWVVLSRSYPYRCVMHINTRSMRRLCFSQWCWCQVVWNVTLCCNCWRFEGITVLRNVGNNTASHPRRLGFSALKRSEHNFKVFVN